jgi:hypothetical protein
MSPPFSRNQWEESVKQSTADIQRTTRRFVIEDRTLHSHRCEDSESCIIMTSSKAKCFLFHSFLQNWVVVLCLIWCSYTDLPWDLKYAPGRKSNGDLCLTGSLWRRQSQQSFNSLTPFNFLFYSLQVTAPTGHLQVRDTISYYFCFWRTNFIQWICCTYAIWL